MLIEELFLQHRLPFIPYFNNPQGRGEGRVGEVSTPNDGLYGLYYPKRGVMKRKEFHYLKNMKGYREFCHFVLYYDQKVLLKDFMPL